MSLKKSFLIFSVFILAGCGDSVTTTPSTGCTGTGALILVKDLFLQPLCGCQEGNGTAYGPGQTMTCTLSGAGSVVFQFDGDNRSQHQILPEGTPALIGSPMVLVHPKRQATQHGQMLTTSGTYVFFDALVPVLRGQIVVP